MPTFEYSSRLATSAPEVFKWHTRTGAFERLSPPWMDVRVIDRQGGVTNGGRVTLQLRKGPLRTRWLLEHRDVQEPRQFCDIQIQGPFKAWRHQHRFEPDGPAGCIVYDRIDYDLPAGHLGQSLAGRSIEQMLGRLFRYRHQQLQHDLSRHAIAAGYRPQRIVVSGATGLIGSHLCQFLASGGHHVSRLVREMPAPGTADIHWRPAAGQIDAAALEGADILVHLSGENLLGRWTEAKKEAIRTSRVDSTRLLCETLARLSRKPRVLISASATGYYGDRGAEPLTEDAAPGSNFLAEVCQQWEAAAEAARQAGIRVVHPRIGVVLTSRGGALRAMLPAFRFGLGGSIGSGCQYISWIDIDDLLGSLHAMMFGDEPVGPVNAVAPHPLPQREFARTLGQVLHRPVALNMPGPLLRWLMGEVADNALLSSQRVLPQRLLQAGFAFHWPNLLDSLRHQFGQFA